MKKILFFFPCIAVACTKPHQQVMYTNDPPRKQDSQVKCRTYDGHLLFVDDIGNCYYRSQQGQKELVLQQLCHCQ